MSLSEKVPVKSKNIEVYPFDNHEFVIKQTEYGYQINVNRDTLDVLELVDGKRSLENISELFIGAPWITPVVLDKLLFGSLAKYGIIETETVVNRVGKPIYLKLSFTLLKSIYIKPIAKFLSPLFSEKIFYRLLIFCSTLVLGTLIIKFDSLKASLEALSLNQWVFYFVFAGIVLFFHEIGHATACKRFGAKFGDIGFGFYLLAPVMYADVSDVWKLKPSKRVIVNLAGIYNELLIATILITIYHLTGVIEYLAYSSIISFSVFTNLNPFLRYDGYWIITDLLGLPNLRKESNRMLIGFLKNDMPLDWSNRKVLFLVLYGLISNILIFLVLGTILIYDSNGLINFPKNIYNYIAELIIHDIKPRFSDFYRFILPLVFYMTIINLSYSFLKSSIKKNKKSS